MIIFIQNSSSVYTRELILLRTEYCSLTCDLYNYILPGQDRVKSLIANAVVCHLDTWQLLLCSMKWHLLFLLFIIFFFGLWLPEPSGCVPSSLSQPRNTRQATELITQLLCTEAPKSPTQDSNTMRTDSSLPPPNSLESAFAIFFFFFFSERRFFHPLRRD